MKRILSLDGGGIRGIFSLQILARIEELFRQERAQPDLVLADVFDFIAGTSTGAIIAAFLSWGMPVREIERMYIERGPQMFSRQTFLRRWRSKYRADAIADFFREVFREGPDGASSLLGTSRLKTLLLIVMRNASTGSPWPVSNNPGAMFNDRTLGDCNLNVPLWQLLRASTAAPAYFPPEQISIGQRRSLFVDGGVTPFNNPALIAVLMATLPQYRLGWPTGREALHVISVGTGSVRSHLPQKLAERIHLVDHLKFVIPALLGTISFEQDLLCRVIGDCIHGAALDSELGKLDSPSLLTGHEQKFTYARYDQSLDTAFANAQQAKITAALDDLRLIPMLQQIGREYAQMSVRTEHLYARGQIAPAGA